MQVEKMANQSSNDGAPKETSFNNRKDELEEDKLTRKYNLVEEMNFLFVRIVKVIDFPNIPNLYIEVKLGNMKATTIYSESKLSWNQVFAFEKDKIHADNLVVLVKDKTMPINMFIGRVQFIVGEIPTRRPTESSSAPQWYRLEDQTGANLDRGALMLSLWFGTQADEYFPQAWCSDTTRISSDAIAYTRSKVYMSPTLWYLRVNVIQAQDLLLRFPPESSEIFVQADLGTLRTRTCFSKNKSAKPFWNEDLMFVAQEPFNEKLVLSIVQRTPANHVCLGTYTTNLKDVQKRTNDMPAESFWYDLDQPGMIGTAPYAKFASKLNARISLDGGYHVSDEPIEYSSDYRPSSKQLWNSSVGILEVGILKATDLLAMKMGGRTDAYCVAKYGPKWVRTRTIVDSLSPNWNEQYVWEVYEPFTVITIAVVDNNQLDSGSRARGTRDTIMAKIRIRLSTLERNKLYTHSYPLIGLHPFGVNKMGEIHLAVRFSTGEFPWSFNMFRFYSTTPLIPSMHLLLPLSPKQFDNLRNQAARIIETSLSRAEPPLGREVVSNILDMSSDVWSMRKGIANYYRIMSLTSDFIAFWKWLEDIKLWKNSFESFLFIVQCLIFVLYPEPMLPLACFYFFVIGLNNYRKRPGYPCHIDATLSCVDTATQDDLQEEFDLVPTQFGGEHLRRQYDQLRRIGRNVQIQANHLAVFIDKLQSLSSWRDPRATLLFLVYCVFGFLVTFFAPFKASMTIWILYYLRAPRFRNVSIFSVGNLFDRMPSNEAFIL
ncbi:unnamed protein product [Trifolium pratense]|uniref:Uncharacterized protein n=1 Tax=Trifolium pratense TaxID=57577 RepID=A0ACB0K198_TRIPR|nr:unnamed protein product [Trifolium pratense]